MNNILLKAESLGKHYPLPKGTLRVFGGLDFELEEGELVAIMGVSGVGKTTLLNLLGALDRPSEGRIILDGEDLFSRPEKELAAIRNRKIGFIFQFYHLLPEFSAAENVAIPLMIRGCGKTESLAAAVATLKEVGLEDKAPSRPSQLSGGEQQRVAIARALLNNPTLILADEPTGNLDSKTSSEVMNIFKNLNEAKGMTIVMVTHEPDIAAWARKRIYLLDGLIVKEEQS